MYSLHTGVLPSFVLILMGSIDCLTTVVGILYYGAAEMNPLLTGIISSSILAFMVLKITATFCIAGTYTLAKRTLNKTVNKSSKSFRFGNVFIKIAYVGLVVFLTMVVTNNLIVLLS